jgi:small-conductance mechanosensitive channel
MGLIEANDISGLLQEYGPFVLIVLGLIVLVAYLYLYISRFFAYLKMKKAGTYIHEDTLDAAHRYIKVIGIGLLILAVVVVGELIHARGFDGFFELVRDYAFVFNAIVVFFVFVILGRLGSDAVRHHRLKAEADTQSYFKPGILEFWELFLKYGMYLFGLLLAILIGIATIPNAATRNDIYEALGLDTVDTTTIWGDLLLLAVVLIVLFLLGKFISIILEDFKHRSIKFQPGLVDLIKALLKYSLYWVAFVLTITIILDMVQFEQLDIIIMFIVGLTLAIVVILGISPVTRNAISGIALLTTDSINRGDWIRVGDGKIGIVVSQGLTITRLKTRTGDIIDLPNELVMGSRVHNFSKLGGTLVRIAVKIDSSVSGQTAEKLLLEAANGLDESDENHSLMKVSLLSLDTASVEYNVDIWRKNPATTEETISEFLKRFKRKASAEGVIIRSTRLND